MFGEMYHHHHPATQRLSDDVLIQKIVHNSLYKYNTSDSYVGIYKT